MKERKNSEEDLLSPEQKNAKHSSAVAVHTEKTEKSDKSEKPKKGLSKATVWTIRITVITFVLSAFFAFISELTSSQAHVSISLILLIFLVVLSIVFDAIGVATTSCDLAPLLSMASRKVPGSKKAILLVKNAERVSNICCDVIGDICGIISGACTVAIVLKLVGESGDITSANYWISIALSSVVCALTVGGKSLFKNVAIKNSKEMVMFVGRLLSIFTKEK